MGFVVSHDEMKSRMSVKMENGRRLLLPLREKVARSAG
jgi:hypothetical protein